VVSKRWITAGIYAEERALEESYHDRKMRNTNEINLDPDIFQCDTHV